MFESRPEDTKKKSCTLGAWMSTLSDTDRVNLQVWLDSDAASAKIREMVLSEAKKGFAKETYAAHRNKTCICSTL